MLWIIFSKKVSETVASLVLGVKVFFPFKLLNPPASEGKPSRPLISRPVVHFPAPPVHALVCPWERYLTTNCSWWHIGIIMVRMSECKLECKTPWMVWPLEKFYISVVHLFQRCSSFCFWCFRITITLIRMNASSAGLCRAWWRFYHLNQVYLENETYKTCRTVWSPRPALGNTALQDLNKPMYFQQIEKYITSATREHPRPSRSKLLMAQRRPIAYFF